MRETLLQKLYEYMRDNNPDVLIGLQETGQFEDWLEQKLVSVTPLLAALQAQQPGYMVEDILMQELTHDLHPSRFLYVSATLESAFENHFQQLQAGGLLQYELLNLLTYCHPVFDVFGFSEANEDSRFLHYTIIGTIREYLEQREQETEDYGIQRSQAIRS